MIILLVQRSLDSKLMISGYLIMFLYTIIMLGKVSLKEVRLFLTAAGLICIAMGMGIAVGISSTLGYPYTPVNVILPFICLGEYHIDTRYLYYHCTRYWY